MKFPELFLQMAQLVSSKSKDRSTKVGAVIVGEDNEVLSVGYNGFPRGVNDDVECRHERPTKYEFTEHAERNAIFNAARQGIRLKGSTMFLNWEPYPCPDCARAVIQSGITKVVGTQHTFGGKGQDWQARFEHTKEMLEEAGVEIEIVEVDDNF
jgi:dCMP deaminase